MFRGKQIRDYFEEAIVSAKSSIQNEQDSYIYSVDAQELVDYHYSQIHLDTLEIDSSREKYMETDKEVEQAKAGANIAYRILSEDTVIERDIVLIYIPITPNINFTTIWNLAPSTNFLSGSPPLSYKEDGWVFFKLYMRSLELPYSEGVLVQEIQNYEQRIYKYFEFRNKDIKDGERLFRSQIYNFIMDRKRRLSNKEITLNSLTKSINIPLRRKKNLIDERIKINEKNLVKRIKPEASKDEEYVIDRGKVLDIIHYLDNQGLQFEKTPYAFSSLGEEHLRDVLLVNLNSIFEGRATGETFSAKGHSDIYLNLEKGNILVFECKIWKGIKLLHQTIDQLLGYLTWRYNYAVIIFFCRNSDFSKILSQVIDGVESHKSYLRASKTIKDHHFSSINKLTSSESKEVEIHYLFYNLYAED